MIVPKDEERRKRSRTNIALFVNPNLDEVISPLEGDKTIKPFTLRERFGGLFDGTRGLELGYAL